MRGRGVNHENFNNGLAMKEQLKELGYWLEDRLKGLCGEITPDKRLAVILVMLVLFTAANLFFTICSIYNLGKDAGRTGRFNIEHIEEPGLQRKGTFEDLIDPDIEPVGMDSIFYKPEIERT